MNDDRPTSDQPGLSLSEAATLLGISREAVRLRVRRGTLRAEQRAGRLVVWVGDQGDRPATDRPTSDQTTRRPRQQGGQSPAQRIAWLEELVMRQQATIDSLTLAVNREQETALRLTDVVRALPAPGAAAEMPTEASTLTATPPDAGELPDTTVVDRELKSLGLSKKKRRRLLDRLSGLFGLSR